MRRHGIERVADGVRGAAEAHRDALRMFERLRRQLLHFEREGGGEKHRLALRRHGRDDAPDVGQEAHVEHAVAFVEDEDFDPVHLRVSLRDQVEQAARTGDEDLHAVSQRLDLGSGPDSAVDGRAPQPRPGREDADHVVDLVGQFARRRDDEGARRVARSFEQFVENGEDERGGLAGPGLRGADDVASAQGGRDGRFLDRRGGFVARLFDPGQQAGIEIELREVHLVPVLQKSSIACT